MTGRRLSSVAWFLESLGEAKSRGFVSSNQFSNIYQQLPFQSHSFFHPRPQDILYYYILIQTSTSLPNMSSRSDHHHHSKSSKHRSSGGGKHKSSEGGSGKTAPQTADGYETWTCHRCVDSNGIPQSGGMTVKMNPQCPNCDHTRCHKCEKTFHSYQSVHYDYDHYHNDKK